MGVRLPITDRFLLKIYECFEGLEKMFDIFILPRSISQLIYWDFLKMKRIYERKWRKRRFFQFINYLKRKGYIRIENLKEKRGILLTKNGFEKVWKLILKLKKKKRRKDGKYEMIIFDIPERKRKLRNLLREYLRFLGYVKIQQSVWVTPFDVSRETENFLRFYSLDKYVKLFLIEPIDV